MWLRLITLVCKGCDNGERLGGFDKFSHAEHESGLKSCPPRRVFEKLQVESSKRRLRLFLDNRGH